MGFALSSHVVANPFAAFSLSSWLSAIGLLRSESRRFVSRLGVVFSQGTRTYRVRIIGIEPKDAAILAKTRFFDHQLVFHTL